MTPEEFTRIRKRHWRRQSDAARALGYSGQHYISYFETGEKPIPERTEKLLRYIDKYGVDEKILGRREKRDARHANKT